MEYSHPLGNLRIKFVKFLGKIFSIISINVLRLFFKIDKNSSELIISSAFYAPWKEDTDFKKFNNIITGTTLLDNKRLFTLYYLSKSQRNVAGDILDIGCLKGGAGFVMSYANKKGKVHLIDTFEGIVENEKYHKKDHFIFENIGFVKNKIKELKLKNTYVHKGTFPNSFKKKILSRKIKLCHIDVNTFQSTKKTFEHVEKKLVKNGIVVFDDYGIFSVNGVKNYVDELMKNKKNFIFLNNYMGQCILIKK